MTKITEVSERVFFARRSRYREEVRLIYLGRNSITSPGVSHRFGIEDIADCLGGVCKVFGSDPTCRAPHPNNATTRSKTTIP